MPRPSTLLLDTNVWFDNYFGTREDHQASCALIDLCQETDVDLFIAAVALKDLYFQIGAELKRRSRAHDGTLNESTAKAVEEIAWKSTLNVVESATVVPFDLSDITTARRFHEVHRDFEDDLVLAAAERAGVDYLVTNDRKLIRHAPVAALTPSDMLALLKAFE